MITGPLDDATRERLAKVRRRAQQLQALADSRSEGGQTGEADSASRYLASLLAKYGLTASDLAGEDPFVLELVTGYPTQPTHVSFVISILRRFFRVEVLEAPLTSALGQRTFQYHIFGRAADVARAKHAFILLSRQYPKLWDELREFYAFSGFEFSSVDQQAYYAGLTIGLAERYQRVTQAAPDSQSLVPVQCDREVEQEAEERFDPTPYQTHEIDLRRHPEMMNFGYGDGLAIRLDEALSTTVNRSIKASGDLRNPVYDGSMGILTDMD